MTPEELIPPLLNTLVNGRCWWDATPDELPVSAEGAILPFLLLVAMGGQDQEYVEQVMPGHTNMRLQIMAFDRSSIAARSLLDSARDRMLASEYSVGVLGSPVGTFDPARKLRGRFQQLSVWLPTT